MDEEVLLKCCTSSSSNRSTPRCLKMVSREELPSWSTVRVMTASVSCSVMCVTTQLERRSTDAIDRHFSVTMGRKMALGKRSGSFFFFRRRSGRFTFRFHFVATFSFLCSHLFASSAMATGGEPSPPWTDEQMHKDDVSKKDLVTFLQENGAKKVRLFPSSLPFFLSFFFFFFFFAEKHVATLIVHMYKQLIVAMFLLGSFWKNTRFSEKLQALPRDRRRTTWSQLIINFSKPRWAHRFLFIVYFSTSSFFLLPVSFSLFLILPFFPSSFSFPAFLFLSFFLFFFFLFVCLPDCLCQEVTFHVAVGGSVFH